MKRSEINRLLERAMGFFKKMGWYLPPFAFYPAQDWSSIINDEDKSRMHSQILNKCLGWDVTDFGSGEFEQEGLLLFTLRNGDMGTSRSYAEKIMLVEEDQVTPWHYHWQKSEDIINRGGGNLVLELYWAAEVERKSPMDPQVEGEFNTEKSIDVLQDGIFRPYSPGSKVVIEPGESIVLPPFLYHKFYGEGDKGPVMVGEVSRVNDDLSDNRFYKKMSRYSPIENDVPPTYLLCNEYAKINQILSSFS